MSILSQQKDGATIIAEDTEVYLDWSLGNTTHARITAPAASNNCTLPQIRMKKVLAVRQQLAEGTYDIDGRLNVALDCLIEDLIG